jgi:hypothetical protein
MRAQLDVIRWLLADHQLADLRGGEDLGCRLLSGGASHECEKGQHAGGHRVEMDRSHDELRSS